MHPGKTVRTTATFVGIVYAVVLYAEGIRLQNDVKHALAYLPSLLTLLVVVYDRWAWRWSIVRHFHKRPLLHGLWSVSIEPDPRSCIPKGGDWHPTGFLVIEQTYWTISLTQFTKESSSYSKSTTWQTRESSGKQALTFLFDNKPKRAHIDRSRQHLGGCLLEVANGTPTSMSGEYFTERFTAGSMDLSLIDRTTNYVDFGQAEKHRKSIKA